ncbi:hypothetical protein [Kordiimonas sp. SCSIO 12610]|uniref:hypothetical protein n=1 Tax=Kordiimonas sp. SCSIO 12610 TaxID=2829597 RepID=UPI002108D995|nr:hypothetical protein [Kordiimonas sp. SCSIO 12610]UTW55565.1 hypothetical protein KFF44_01330 [Kordiimonas sp. SCSIO 12610]
MTIGEKLADVIIARRFNGPPSSGNGGYVSGLVGAHIKGAAEVSLRLPPPLDTAMEISRNEDGVILHTGETIYGVGKSAIPDLEVPSLSHGLTYDDHPSDVKFQPFDTCFVCGDARTLGDGLCIHAKPITGYDGHVGANWKLHKSLADKDGFVDPVYIWSALDCPGYAACAYGEPALLARMTTKITAKIKCEGTAFVMGWSKGASGRKRFCGTAIYDQDCNLIAASSALWVVVKSEQIAV